MPKNKLGAVFAAMPCNGTVGHPALIDTVDRPDRGDGFAEPIYCAGCRDCVQMCGWCGEMPATTIKGLCLGCSRNDFY